MRVLVVDDEVPQARMVSEHLNEAGHRVVAVTTGAEAVAELGREQFDAVVTDLKMDPPDGMAVLRAAREVASSPSLVLMTAYGKGKEALEAIQLGAYFIPKPFPLEGLRLLLERLERERRLARENEVLRRQLHESERFREMVGKSRALGQVRELAAKVAPSETSVLILGESGVGKELVARMVHRLSPRAERPFVVVHAAALPESLLESELFGYEKGAFTGATGRKQGRLEVAEGGTLFLDEIGEISSAFQVKLLRFLQEKTFFRVGGNQVIKVDTRVVAATNRDLQEEVRAGRFREDLYYRLAVFPITVPPLRDRKSDIPALARHVLARLGHAREPDEKVLALLADYDWPGNVRELENVLERALILAGGDEVGPQHIQLPEAVLVRPAGPGGGQSLPAMEEEMLRDALRRAAGNKSKAAKLLGITRRMLYTKLARFGIEQGNE